MNPAQPARRCWAEIDLAALRHNVAAARAQLAPDVKVMAVVKANAYGHGLRAVAQALAGQAEMFGVANVAEAEELRGYVNEPQIIPISTEKELSANSRALWLKATRALELKNYGYAISLIQNILKEAPGFLEGRKQLRRVEIIVTRGQMPIFILGPALPDERARIASARFIPAISTVEEARAYAALAGWEPLPVHLKLDTGMGRIGILEKEALRIAREILAVRGIAVTGLASHLPVADEDDTYTRDQLARFHALVGQLRAIGITQPVVHIDNSAGIIAYPAQAGDMVRAGLMMYGSAPIAEFQPKLRAVMTWKTRITLIRDMPAGHGISYGRTFITKAPMRIATLAVGYADGYQRHLTNKGAEVLIHGRRCPVLGRVTMDQILVDVTALPEVREGDEVVLMGRQGNEEILAAELAQKSGTIAWEIFTGVGRRVERVYLDRE